MSDYENTNGLLEELKTYVNKTNTMEELANNILSSKNPTFQSQIKRHKKHKDDSILLSETVVDLIAIKNKDANKSYYCDKIIKAIEKRLPKIKSKGSDYYTTHWTR